MSTGAAALLLGTGGLLAAGWLAGMVWLSVRRAPPRQEVLAATGFSALQIMGGAVCFGVFGSLWGGELLLCIAGAEHPPDWTVILLGGGLTLAGMAVLWMSLVRRVWCTSSALVQRTWRGQLVTAPYRELAGGKAAFSFDDMILPWGEGRLVLDRSLPGFAGIAAYLERQGVDLSATPPRRSFLSKKNDDPFARR